MPCSLKLTRRGSFSVKHVDGGSEADKHQCGIRGTRKFFFRVEVTCSESALDHRGFMVDQFDIQRLMKTRYATTQKLPSCERLAIDACHAVAELCPYAQHIAVTIGSGKFAYMTAELPLQHKVA